MILLKHIIQLIFDCLKSTIETLEKVCSKLTVKTPERRHWRRSGIFIVNFNHISHFFLEFLLLTLNKLNVSWEAIIYQWFFN